MFQDTFALCSCKLSFPLHWDSGDNRSQHQWNRWLGAHPFALCCCLWHGPKVRELWGIPASRVLLNQYLVSSWCCLIWAKKMIPLAQEFLSDVCIAPQWVALTGSQTPRWCGISAPWFTSEGTLSFAATLLYRTIFTVLCLLFSPVWFPHKIQLREFSPFALQVHQKG